MVRNIFIVVASLVVIVWGFTLAQDQPHTVNLPIVEEGKSPPVRTAGDGPIVGIHPQFGVYSAMAITGTLADDDPIRKEIYEKMSALATAGQKIVPAHGDTTAGGVVEVAGKVITMPQSVYIDAFIVSASCVVGVECPETPVYVLRNKDTGSTLSVSSPTGNLINNSQSEEEFTRLKEEFKWLINAIEGGK